jgi:hypothetical protein
MHFATLLATVLYVLATPVPDPDPDPRGKRSPTSTVFPTPPPTFYPVSASAPTYTSSYVPTPPSPPGGHPVWYGGIPSTEIWIYGPKYLPMWFTCVGAKRVRKNSGVQM